MLSGVLLLKNPLLNSSNTFSMGVLASMLGAVTTIHIANSEPIAKSVTEAHSPQRKEEGRKMRDQRTRHCIQICSRAPLERHADHIGCRWQCTLASCSLAPACSPLFSALASHV